MSIQYYLLNVKIIKETTKNFEQNQLFQCILCNFITCKVTYIISLLIIYKLGNEKQLTGISAQSSLHYMMLKKTSFQNIRNIHT